MKGPWHLWVVGILAILWNMGGCYDFIMTVTQNEAYLSQLTDEQRQAYTSMPSFYYVLFGLAVWGGLIGSLLLLMRKALASTVYMISLASMAITFAYTHFIADLDMKMTSMEIAFTAAIIVVAVFLLIYSKRMGSSGYLN